MKTEINIWNKENYQEYIDYLISLKNEKYKNFHSKLTTTKYEILGINLPMQRKIAKMISKSDIKTFLDNVGDKYYEEVLITTLVLASSKDKDLVLKYLDKFINKIDNWAICDSFCNSFKIVNSDKEFWFNYFKNNLKVSEEFKVRVSLIIFLNFYIEENYLDNIFKLIDNIKLDKYYVNMGIAWFLCECFVKYYEKTLNYFLNSKINTFTFNKTISKINDSYRISDNNKKYLSTLRRKD